MVGYHQAMTQVGLAITFLTTTILVIGFFRHRQRRLAFYGLAGLVGLLSGEILCFRRRSAGGDLRYSDRVDLLHPARGRRRAGHARAFPSARCSRAVCWGCITLSSTLVDF